VFVALLVLSVALVFQLLPVGNDASMKLQVIGYTVALFVACMVCHGELYQLKPAPKFLTAYFLYISAWWCARWLPGRGSRAGGLRRLS
jgi:hypothetical protein